jgi:hypothetical protein
MANNRKEQERAELHRTIWNIANDLRGSVDGWDFKQSTLIMACSVSQQTMPLLCHTPQTSPLPYRFHVVG